MLKNAGSDGAAGPQTAGPHNLILENRAQMTATGVLRMIRCDESEASMETSRGTLTVQGRGLSVSALSIETGEVHLTGQVDDIEYTENRASAGGFWRRLIR